MADLGTLGGDSSFAYGINDWESGVVVGGGHTTTGSSHAFLWWPTTGMVDLGTFGGSDSYANGINTAQIVGRSNQQTGTSTRSFGW